MAETAQSILDALDPAQAEKILTGLAEVFLNSSGDVPTSPREDRAPNLEAQYRTLIEQIPAVVFMVYLDRGVGEAYVNPQIETCWAFRGRNGWKTRFAGTRGFIRTTSSAGAPKPPRCFSPDSRCVRFTVSLRATDAWCPFTAMPGWSGARTAARGLFTASGSTSPTSNGSEEALQEERNFAVGGAGHGGGPRPGDRSQRADRALQPGVRTNNRVQFERSDRPSGVGPASPRPTRAPDSAKSSNSSAPAGCRVRTKRHGPRGRAPAV